MNLKRLLGLDIAADRYAYAVDQVTGYVSAQKVADRWVSTTCGYCSVGCGMFIGVTNGRAVAVRGNPDHPVNVASKKLHDERSIVDSVMESAAGVNAKRSAAARPA